MPEVVGARVLVAGLGNVFLGDDAFGVEVVQRLASLTLPPDVRLMDVGTRSLHLAYVIAEGEFDTAILVDAVSRGQAPGTLYVIEPETVTGNALVDAHGVRPEDLISLVRALGGHVDRILIVGCEPACLDEKMGLSETVAATVDTAARLVLQLASESVTARQS